MVLEWRLVLPGRFDDWLRWVRVQRGLPRNRSLTGRVHSAPPDDDDDDDDAADDVDDVDA